MFLVGDTCNSSGWPCFLGGLVTAVGSHVSWEGALVTAVGSHVSLGDL